MNKIQTFLSQCAGLRFAASGGSLEHAMDFANKTDFGAKAYSAEEYSDVFMDTCLGLQQDGNTIDIG